MTDSDWKEPPREGLVSVEFRDHEGMTIPTSDEMKSALEASGACGDARLVIFDTSVKTSFADLRAEMANFRAEMHRGMANLRKWSCGIALAAVAATVGLVTFFDESADRLQPGPAALIVIYVQPQPPATPPAPVTPAPEPKR